MASWSSLLLKVGPFDSSLQWLELPRFLSVAGFFVQCSGFLSCVLVRESCDCLVIVLVFSLGQSFLASLRH